MTKAGLATVATLATLALGGYVAPALIFAALVVPGAVVARGLRRVVRAAVLVTLPLAIAVGLVSLLTRPGATLLFELGPFDVTLEGADFAARVAVRLFVMAAALALFGHTTTPRAFATDLERRGIPPRVAFALGSVIGAIPALAERAREVRDAQRARGLETEGHLLRRAAAVVPLAAPAVIGAFHQVEARSMALEARAFGRPGTRYLLWAPPDTTRERAARWALVIGFVIVAAGSVTGVLPKLP